MEKVFYYVKSLNKLLWNLLKCSTNMQIADVSIRKQIIKMFMPGSGPVAKEKNAFPKSYVCKLPIIKSRFDTISCVEELKKMRERLSLYKKLGNRNLEQ